MDKSITSIRLIFEKTYGKESTTKWIAYWRTFFISVAELFGYNNGDEWMVAHYLFQKKQRLLLAVQHRTTWKHPFKSQYVLSNFVKYLDEQLVSHTNKILRSGFKNKIWNHVVKFHPGQFQFLVPYFMPSDVLQSQANSCKKTKDGLDNPNSGFFFLKRCRRAVCYLLR